jgi:hypothetical protein
MTTSDAYGHRHRIVAITTAICAVVAVALLLWRPHVALGFVGGAITGAGMLSALVMVLNRLVVPPGERKGHPAPWVVLHVAKFALAAAIAWVVIELLGGDVIAFAAGYTMALLALIVILAYEPSVSNGLGGTGDASDEDNNT